MNAQFHMFRHVYKHTNKTIRIILCRGGGGCNHIIPRPIVGLPESVSLDLPAVFRIRIQVFKNEYYDYDDYDYDVDYDYNDYDYDK